jgi:hypothetical protein
MHVEGSNTVTRGMVVGHGSTQTQRNALYGYEPRAGMDRCGDEVGLTVSVGSHLAVIIEPIKIFQLGRLA